MQQPTPDDQSGDTFEKRWIETDFAALEARVLAAMLPSPAESFGFGDVHAAFEKHCLGDGITSTVADRPTRPSFTLEMLEEVMERAERQLEDQREKEVEAYLLAGMKVMVNEHIPNGKIAILPAEYAAALDRVLDRLRKKNRQEGQVSALQFFYGNPHCTLFDLDRLMS